jgi:hypothetical protein
MAKRKIGQVPMSGSTPAQSRRNLTIEVSRRDLTVSVGRRDLMASVSRRDLMVAMALAGGGLCSPTFASSRGQKHTVSQHTPTDGQDWRWLEGNWDVWHRRLTKRLAGSNDWQEFGGNSALWLTMNGFGTIDDNIVDLPGDSYRGMTIRGFDQATRRWSIWWLDGRNPTRIDPPVVGKFEGDHATFVGRDEFAGRPIVVRFRWLDIHSRRPHWEQAFSTDDGATWEVNWNNYFTRTSATPSPLPRLDAAPRDWDFLVGSWQVRNRRLKQRLVGASQWEEFDNTLTNWPVLGGFGNVGDNVFHAPSGSYCGVSVRAFDPDRQEWLSWWLDSRNAARIGPPTRGRFEDGVGTLIGDDVHDGKPIKVRSQWSRITASSAHWEQASSTDDGASWETNWVADFARKA